MNNNEAMAALDKVIKKSRIHFYKPVQIAEILYPDRMYHDVDLSSLETYRTQSKKWRDDMSMLLLGRVCTSSSKFQDNLFDDNAVPPSVLEVLGKINRDNNGSVERHIYTQFMNRHSQLSQALEYCRSSDTESFNVKDFIDSFRYEAGLKRSLDKVYEIIVYALFSALAEALNLKINISIDSNGECILEEFSDFTEKVMCLKPGQLIHSEPARIYRAGVTNAADRGIDMYSSWGSDRIIIVCKDAERNIILSLLTQIGWRSHIQSIITESDLVLWYEKALRGRYSHITGGRVLDLLREEIASEFPPADNMPELLRERYLKTLCDDYID